MNEYIIQQQNAFPYATGDLSRLLSHIVIAAGYVLYGSSTMLVYTTGLGVTGFTYECNPIAFLAEQSGGMATDGMGDRILEIKLNN